MRGHLNSRHQIILEDKNSNDVTIKENETPNSSKMIKADVDEIEPIDVLETETNIVPDDEYGNSNVEPVTKPMGYPRSTVSIKISDGTGSKLVFTVFIE